MKDEFSNLSDQEQKKAENEFLKMKLLIEQGTELGYPNGEGLPVDIENMFLKDILAFEERYRHRKQVTVFEKLGKPQQFRPVAEIADEDMRKAWDEVEDCLQKNGIELHTCSPNINTRELYRFTTEELFKHQMEDIPMAGWITTFIYDEFYPDPVYESEKIVETELFPEIFHAEVTSDYFRCFCREHIHVNGRAYATDVEFIDCLNFLKSFYSKMLLQNFSMRPAHRLDDNTVVVTGNYEAQGHTEDSHLPVQFKGGFRVGLTVNEYGYWNIKTFNIEGIDFPEKQGAGKRRN